MKSGTITFRLVNVDDKANAQVAEDFGAYGTALFLHVHKNGKAEKIDLTEWAFIKGGKGEGLWGGLSAGHQHQRNRLHPGAN